MANPQHTVVLEGLESDGRSNYTIKATGEIDMKDGMLDGVEVSRDSDAPVSGSTQEGTVWAGADGYEVYGAIKSIDIENPSHVQLHVSKMAGPPDGEECQVVIRLDSVDFMEGQGIGEGALELVIEADIIGEQSIRTEQFKLPTGSSHGLGESVESFNVARGQSEPKTIKTKVYEIDEGVGEDWFTGNDDYGEEPLDIVLQCDEPKTESVEVPISSGRDSPGKVRVNYQIDDLSR